MAKRKGTPKPPPKSTAAGRTTRPTTGLKKGPRKNRDPFDTPDLSDIENEPWFDPRQSLSEQWLHRNRPIWQHFGRCTAKSKRKQRRCMKVPILGATVCEMHGGAAPQVKDAAHKRLMELKLPAVYRLAQLIEQDAFPSTALGAVVAVFDRTGMAPEHKVKHAGKVEQATDKSLSDDIKTLIRESEAILEEARRNHLPEGDAANVAETQISEEKCAPATGEIPPKPSSRQ